MAVSTKNYNYKFKSKYNSRKKLTKSKKKMINIRLITNKSNNNKIIKGGNIRIYIYILEENEDYKLQFSINKKFTNYNEIYTGIFYVIYKPSYDEGDNTKYNETKIKLYNGEFKINKKNDKNYFIYHGFGTEYYKTGEPKYVGEWQDNKANGDGILYYKNGKIKYSGKWKCNVPSGYGVKYGENNNIKIDGIWKKVSDNTDNCSIDISNEQLTKKRLNLNINNNLNFNNYQLKNTPKNKKLIEMANQLEEFNKNPTKKELTENLKNIIKFRNA